MDLGLEGKIALVGASSKGLGKACALGLAAEGARVTICARSKADLEATADELVSSTGAEVQALVADLSQVEDVQRVVSATVERFGGLDIVICNVGGPPTGNFWDVDDRAWLDAFELVNLSAIRFIREAVPHMRKRGWGRIVTIQSSSVKQPIDNLILSNGLRPGIAGLFKALMPDLAEDGITINVVLPGVILTDRITKGLAARAEKAGASFDEQVAVVSRNVPLGRIGDPAEIANVVVFLASERASYVTGAVVQVDGGSIRSVV